MTQSSHCQSQRGPTALPVLSNRAIFSISELDAKSDLLSVVDVRFGRLQQLAPLQTSPASRSAPVDVHCARRMPPGARAKLRQRHHLPARGGAVERRAGRHRTARGRGRHGSRAAEFGEASLELDVEAAVEDRVDGAVEQRQRLGESVDRFREDVAVLGPDVDEMDEYSDNNNNNNEHICIAQNKNPQMRMWMRWTTKYGVQHPMNAQMILSVI